MSVKRKFAASIDLSLREALEGDLDGLISSGELLKNDKTTTVAKVGLAGVEVVIKRYNARSLGHRFKRALRQSRAMRCWLMSKKFELAGLQVAPRLAMVEKRLGPFRLDAYFIAQWVEANELLAWLPEQSSKQKKSVKQQIVHIFSAFKQYRLSHGDMKATNLLWKEGQIVFLDLDAATQHESIVLWQRGYRRDKKRFAKNGDSFADLVSGVS